jgi:ornithine--oxo-acid transaminase
VLLLGKALGGGIMPLSAVVARRDVLDVFTPGSHGSTFGGNPLACAIGREVIAMLRTGEPQRRAALLGDVLRDELARVDPRLASSVRTAGLWAGVDLAPALPAARVACEALLARRVLVKDTHHRTLRIAPPIVVTADELRWAVGEIGAVLEELCP